MKSLKQLLNEKHRPLASVAPTDSVYDALKLMAEYDIGAVLVLEHNRLVGILSERDYARKGVLQGKASRETQVREIMSDKVLYVTLTQSVEECMALMTERHVRHLPVLDDQSQVLGVLSIGDFVKETISEQAFLIQQLEHYISG